VQGDGARNNEIVGLVSRAKGGDVEAFDALYGLFGDRVYRYALVRLRHPADAQDLAQVVFLKVIEALPSFQDRGAPFSAWLFRIARNAVIDVERGRRPASTLDALAEQRDTRPGPSQLAEIEADREAVRAALDDLTPEQREVVMLRFFAGLTSTEIAAVMGKRDGTVRALQFRALATLRRRLAGPIAIRTEPDGARA